MFNFQNIFELNKIEEGDFRFCGREYSQADDYSVYVTCKNNNDMITIMRISN